MTANCIERGLIWPNFKIIKALMHVLVTCKYLKNQTKTSKKNRDRSHHYMSMGFVDAHLTRKYVVGFDRNSNSSKLKCMSSLPASLKNDQINCNIDKAAITIFISSSGADSKVSSRIWLKIEFTQAWYHNLQV